LPFDDLRQWIAALDRAGELKRIQTEDYGVCANCQEEMQQKRLEAVPWAKHCIACQEKMEQGLL
jgi:DnaK suppressor protein